MTKIIAYVKSFLIIALAGLAVYQVSELWLVGLTNRSFFLYLQARFSGSAPELQSAFARPYRIVSGAGDGLFEIRYSGIADSDEWDFGETALRAILQSGVFVGMSETEKVLARPVLIYEYAFPMTS
ncbi:MAG: hypothetical protein LBI27_00725, partial [Clostridiales bacterium]|nr:hypothetical protein [Clostridiales bacterium]